MSKFCELCGTPVKVVGKTTMHYEPVGLITIEQLNKVLDELRIPSRSCATLRYNVALDDIRYAVNKLGGQS